MRHDVISNFNGHPRASAMLLSIFKGNTIIQADIVYAVAAVDFVLVLCECWWISLFVLFTLSYSWELLSSWKSCKCQYPECFAHSSANQHTTVLSNITQAVIRSHRETRRKERHHAGAVRAFKFPIWPTGPTNKKQSIKHSHYKTVLVVRELKSRADTQRCTTVGM